MASRQYAKHWIPLESDPDIFTELIHLLGAPTSLHFEDVLSLDDPSLLAIIPRPVLALVLVFPAPKEYEDQVVLEDQHLPDYKGRSSHKDNVVWFKQTIHNACGLYAVLHALCNGQARDLILSVPESVICRILKAGLEQTPEEYTTFIEKDMALESIYAKIAAQGDSMVSENPKDEVEHHYICFVRSDKRGQVHGLNGDRRGPVDCCQMSDADMLSDEGLKLVKDFISKHGGSLGFNLMALVQT